MSYELLISQFKGVSQSPDSDDHFEAALVTLLVLSKLDRTTNALTQLDPQLSQVCTQTIIFDYL